MRASRLAMVLLGSCLGATAVNAQAVQTLPADQAVYDAFYRGQRVGEAEFSVTPIADSTGAHEFRSVLRVTGLYRLIAPGPVEEIGAFVFENGRVRPVIYSLRSGSRGETDNFNIAYDWEQRIATVTAVNLKVQTELVSGALDRGAVRAKTPSGRRPTGHAAILARLRAQETQSHPPHAQDRTRCSTDWRAPADWWPRRKA